MSGQPTPPRILEPFAASAPTCTQATPVAGGKTNPFPVASQIGVLAGAASLTDGFPPLTATAPTSGGVAPFGIDANGILFLLSSWIAAQAAGQYPQFDATLATAMSGYKVGAILQQANNLNAFWINNVDGNSNDPDTGSLTGWLSTVPLYSAAVLGSVNDVVLPGLSNYVIKIGAAIGPFTGFVAQRDSQEITFVNNSGGEIQFNALSGSSAAGHQIQASGNIGVANGDSLTIRYSTGLGKWFAV